MNLSIASNLTKDSKSKTEVVNDVSLCIIFILTIIGNLLLIVSLKFRQSEGLKLVDKLMLNTVVCNVLLVFISIPIDVVQHFYNYPFPDVVCKLIYPFSTYFFNSGVFTYIAIALERWMLVTSIKHRSPTRLQTLLVFMAIHLCGIFSVIPYMPILRVKDVKGRIVCGETWEITARKSYTLSLFLLQYGIPVPLLTVFYAKIWLTVFSSNKKMFRSMLESFSQTLIPSQRSVVRASAPELKSPELRSSYLVAVKEEEEEVKFVQEHRSSNLDKSGQEIMLPRDASLDRVVTPQPLDRLSGTSLFRSELASVTSPSSAHSPKSSSEMSGGQERSQRSHSARFASDYHTFLEISRLRSQSDCFPANFSRSFSITGGVPLKDLEEMNQIGALRHRVQQTRRLLIRFTIITSVFIICMLPHQVHWVIIDFVENGNEFFSEFTRVAIHLITYTNCVVNPLLYGHYDKPFWLKICKMFKR